MKETKRPVPEINSFTITLLKDSWRSRNMSSPERDNCKMILILQGFKFKLAVRRESVSFVPCEFKRYCHVNRRFSDLMDKFNISLGLTFGIEFVTYLWINMYLLLSTSCTVSRKNKLNQ